MCMRVRLCACMCASETVCARMFACARAHVHACVYVRARKAFRATVHNTNNGHLQGYLLEFHNLSRLITVLLSILCLKMYHCLG